MTETLFAKTELITNRTNNAAAFCISYFLEVMSGQIKSFVNSGGLTGLHAVFVCKLWELVGAQIIIFVLFVGLVGARVILFVSAGGS